MVGATDGTVGLDRAGELDRGRSAPSVLHEWFLLTGDRGVIAAALLGGFLAVTTGIELLVGPIGSQPVSLFYMASAVVGGNFTLLTIVISINQLVISRQLSAPGELQEEIENTSDFRDAATDLLETDTAPVTPSAFLGLLYRGVQDSIERLRDREPHLDDEASAALDDLLDSIEGQVDRTAGLLQRCDSGIFQALVVTLDTNYSEDIHRVWQLQTGHGDELAPETTSALSTLVSRLKQIDVARQYLKTLYIQEELSRLSRHLFYVGAPAILSGVAVLQLFVASGSAPVEPRALSALVPVFATVGVAPLAVLFAFVLRLSTVSERTVAVTPFTTPTQEQQPELEESGDAAPSVEE